MSEARVSPAASRDGRELASVPPGKERLELTSADVRRVLTLYAEERAAHQARDAWWVDPAMLASAVRRFWWVVLLGLLFGIGGAVVLLGQLTPLYRVSAQVLIGREDVTASEAATASALGAGSSAFVATQAEVLQSRGLLGEAIARLPAAALTPEIAVEQALDAVQASPVSGTQIVTLGYLGPDADYGSALLTAVVEAYRELLRASERDSQRRRAQAKEAEIALLEEQAAALAQSLQRERAAAGIVGSAEETAATVARALETQRERLAEVRERRLALESQLASGAASRAVSDPAVAAISDRLVTAQAELARLRRSLTPLHPSVAAAERQVAALEEQLATSEDASPRTLAQQIAAERRLEQELETLATEQRRRLAAIEGFEIRERELEARLEQIRSRTDAGRRELLDQQVAVRLAESGGVGVTARLIAAPVVPAAPVWPRPALLLALGAGLGLAGGMTVAMILAHRRRRRERWSGGGAAPAGGASPC